MKKWSIQSIHAALLMVLSIGIFLMHCADVQASLPASPSLETTPADIILQEKKAIEEALSESLDDVRSDIANALLPVNAPNLKGLAVDTMRYKLEREIKQNNGTIKVARIVEIWKEVSFLMGKATMLLTLMPQDFIDTVFSGLSIKNGNIADGPDEYDHSFILEGITTINGVPTKMSMLYAPFLPKPGADKGALKNTQGGISFTIEIPTALSVAALFPRLRVLGKTVLSNRRLIISDFEYNDQQINHKIEAGLTLVGTIDPGAFPLPDHIKKFIDYKSTAFIGLVSIKPNITKSTFETIIPPVLIQTHKFTLGQMLDYSGVRMPSNIKHDLDNMAFKNVGISFQHTSDAEFFAITGLVTLCGSQDVIASYKIFKSIDKKVVNTVSFTMPEGWDITKTFPELKPVLTMAMHEPTIMLVTQSHYDPILEIEVERGLHFFCDVDIKSTGTAPVLKMVGVALGKQVRLHGVLRDPLPTSQFDITLGKVRSHGINLSIGDLIPPQFPHIKMELSKSRFSLGEFKMSFGGMGGYGESSGRHSIKFKGISLLFGQSMPTEFHQILIGGKWKTDMLLSIPGSMKSFDPSLSLLNRFSMPSFRMALIEVPFRDHVHHLEYFAGLNIGGFLPFTGELSFFKQLLPFKGLSGLNVNCVIGKQINMSKLQVGIPNVGISFGHNVMMNDLTLSISLGEVAYEIKGTVVAPIPKQFRPKKGTSGGQTSEPLPEMSFDISANGHDIEISKKALTHAALEEIPSILTHNDVEDIEVATMPSEQPTPTITDVKAEPEEELSSIAALAEEEAAAQLNNDLETLKLSEIPVKYADEDTSSYGPPVSDYSNMATFMGLLGIAGDSGKLACSMDGIVDIYGLILHEIGLQGQINLITGIPSGLGFRAMMEIGHYKDPKIIEFAASMSTGVTSSNFMWLGSFTGGLFLRDIAELATRVMRHGSKLSPQLKDELVKAMKQVPEIGINKISMELVPVATTIAGKTYEEGIGATLAFKLFGLKGDMAVHMDYGSMYGKGSLSKIEFPKKSPQFIVSSFDGTSGPSVTLAFGSQGLGALTNEFILDGNVQIKPLGIQNATKIKLNVLGGSFEMKNKPLFGLYEIALKGDFETTNLASTNMTATFNTNGLTALNRVLRAASKEFIELAHKELDSVRRSVAADLTKEIDEQRAIVRKEHEAARAAVTGAKRTATSKLDKEIASVRARIASVKATLNKRKSDWSHQCNPPPRAKAIGKCSKKVAMISAAGTELASLETYLNSMLKTSRSATTGTLNATNALIKLAPVDADPRVSSLIVAKETALAGIKFGKLSADGINQLLNTLAKIGDEAVNVKEITFKTSIKDLTAGRLPKFTIRGMFFGQPLNLVDVELDVKDAQSFASKCFDYVADGLKKRIA